MFCKCGNECMVVALIKRRELTETTKRLVQIINQWALPIVLNYQNKVPFDPV